MLVAYMNPADMSSSQVGSESVKAITQAYEPGSTFKSVSALTILEQGTMAPRTPCSAQAPSPPTTTSVNGCVSAESEAAMVRASPF